MDWFGEPRLHQRFEGDWKMVHDDVPVVGRASTALFMPLRPDVEKNISKIEVIAFKWRKGYGNPWPIEGVPKGDAMWLIALAN